MNQAAKDTEIVTDYQECNDVLITWHFLRLYIYLSIFIAIWCRAVGFCKG